MNHRDNFIKIHETFWNTPEGQVSVITNYMAGGSLKDLLESSGTISEPIIKVISY